MKRLLFIAFGLILLNIARADSWAAAKLQARTSPNGQYVVRVTPGKSMGDVYGYGGEPKGAYAKAEWYRFNGKSYEKVNEANLLNPISPVDIEVTNSGLLIAIDNWHNLGIGSILVIYTPSGGIIKKYTLLDLYSADDLEKIERTTSSFHWRCPGLSTYLESDTELWVADSLGGNFVFNPSTGSYVHNGDRGHCK
jgi:hypothetical protein